MAAVRAELGPQLPEVIGPRAWRVVRVVVPAIALVVLAVVLTRGSNEQLVRVSKPVAFNFLYTPPLRRTGPTAVEQRRGALLIQSMAVTPERLPPYRGDPAGTLPIVADRLETQLAARWPQFEIADEGRARVNDSPGYTVGWTAVLRGRRIFGREYLLFPAVPGVRAGAHIALLSTYAGGAAAAGDVGRVGALKAALRSFRFGVDRP
jgi:hypothetical protein